MDDDTRSKVSTPPGKAKAKASADTSSMRQVQLLQEKETLTKDIKQAIIDFSGNRSMHTTLKKQAEAIEKDKLATLLTKPDLVLQAIQEKLFAPLRALDEQMPALHLSEVDNKKAILGVLGGLYDTSKAEWGHCRYGS